MEYETYETNTKIPEDGKVVKELVEVQPEIIYETSWPKTILLSVIMIVIGIGLAFAVVSIGATTQFLTDQDCDAQALDAMNQSFINGSVYGYQVGVYETSQMVLTSGILPVFQEDGQVKYLNLTKNLNKQEDKNE